MAFTNGLSRSHSNKMTELGIKPKSSDSKFSILFTILELPLKLFLHIFLKYTGDFSWLFSSESENLTLFLVCGLTEENK